MKTPLPLALGAAAALALAGCTTPAGPVEVTRFVAAERTAELGKGPIFVETAPGGDIDGLALAPYKAAVADELGRLGYREADRSQAGQIAQVTLVRYALDSAGKRSPVSVGVGGSILAAAPRTDWAPNLRSRSATRPAAKACGKAAPISDRPRIHPLHADRRTPRRSPPRCSGNFPATMAKR